MDRMRTDAYKTRTIQSGGVLIVRLDNAPLPCASTLFSTAAGREIAYSPNGLSWFTTATYDGSTAGAITWGTILPMTHVRFTGNNGDVCEIR